MKCESCGGVVAAESAFCPHCGKGMGAADGGTANFTAGAQAAMQRLKPGSRGNANPVSEEELWSGTYSAKAMIGPAVGLALLTIVALVVGSLAPPVGWIIAGGVAIVAWALLGLVLLYRRMTVAYRLTNFRFFHEEGLLNRTRDRIEVIDINDVTLHQTLIERMFGVGTVHIMSSDVTNDELWLKGIEDVRRVTDLIDNTRRAERQRRGVFMENIGNNPVDQAPSRRE